MKIDVKKTLIESFQDVFENRRGWLRIAVAPFLIWCIGFVVMMSTFLVTGTPFSSIDQSFNYNNLGVNAPMFTFGSVILLLTSGIAYICLGINAYRYAAYKEGEHSWWTLNFNWRFVKTIIYSFLVGFLSFIFLAFATTSTVSIYKILRALDPGSVIWSSLGGSVLALFFLVFYLYFIGRIGLTFFLIAIDRLRPIETGWQLLKGNVFRYILLTLVILFVIAVITLLGNTFLYLMMTIPKIKSAVTLLASVFETLTTFVLLIAHAKASSLVFSGVSQQKGQSHP